MREKLRYFMAGRYGSDKLNLFILGAYFFLYVLTSITKIAIFYYIGLILFAICIYRMMSRNIYKRQWENQRYLQKVEPIKKFFRQQKTILTDKQHKYFRCSCCRQLMRVPKNRGKITITCPKCKTQITKKT